MVLGPGSAKVNFLNNLASCTDRKTLMHFHPRLKLTVPLQYLTMAMRFSEEGNTLNKISTDWLEEHCDELCKARVAMKSVEGQNPVYVRLVQSVLAQQ